MLLESFRVVDFRSVNDSGDIEVARITALLGRNESGKSNLLLALRTLNPVEGLVALDATKNFPRHRRLSECKPDTGVLSSLWRLTPDEQNELAKILPRASNVTHVTIGRRYGAARWARFQNLPEMEFDQDRIIDQATRIIEAVQSQDVDQNNETAINAAINQFQVAIAVTGKKTHEWASSARAGLPAFSNAMKAASVVLPEDQLQDIRDLTSRASSIISEREAESTAKKWAIDHLPTFIYLDEYPELDGHQNLAQYLQRRSENKSNESDRNFEKLCKVAGLSPEQLRELQTKGSSEERHLIANRASAIVTREIRRLWHDRKLKVRFDLDAEYFEILVSDPTSDFDVEVNLDERSRGFRWFFSFYITFAADTDGGRAVNAILLLDEPGLFLHIESQKDLQMHFEIDFYNQILYTTHSPFMVPIQALDSLRTVNIDEETGTTVTNNPTGDGRTLAPIRAALGYSAANTLLIGPNNLVLEGVTDWWIIEAVSKHFVSAGRSGLPKELSTPPVDGAPKVPTMVSMLAANKLNVMILLDDEKQARTIRDEMVKARLIREQYVIFVSEAFSESKPSEADIEDLLDPAIYETLVRESYEKELSGISLSLNASIPRIVKRFEAAFEAIGLAFHKTRPAGLFYRKMAADPASVLINESSARFDALFGIIANRLQKMIAAGREPFH